MTSTKRNSTDAVTVDSLLAPWLQAEDDAAAEQRLTQLISAELEPVIKGVIRFKLRLGSSAAGTAEAGDLRQEALTEVLLALQKCKDRQEQHPIADIRGLTATITYRTCSAGAKHCPR